jgi:hypothetical protein
VAVVLSAVLPALAARAQEPQTQSQPPARIGNRWDGLSHQPTQRDVGAAEQELGIAPRDQRERTINNDLDQIMQQLLSKEPNAPAAASGSR